MPVNVELAAVPTDVIATKQTTMISANITAYSTAVGPSSERTNARSCDQRRDIASSELRRDKRSAGDIELTK